MTRHIRRIFVLLDAGGARRGFIADGWPVSATVYGDAQPVGFGPGLEISTLPVRAASLMGEGAADAGSISASLQLDAFDLWALRATVPTQTVKVRAWLAPVGPEGYPVDSAGGEWPLRPEYEIFRGVIRSPNFDLRARTLTFTAEADLRLIDAQFPPSAIDSQRFPATPAASTTNAVPVIYGTTYGLPLYAVSDVTANPVRLIVAGHPIVSTSIDVLRNGAIVDAAQPVLYDIDALGGVYAYVEIPKATYDAGSSLYTGSVTGWRDADGTAIELLGDVLLHMWHTYAAEQFFELDRERCYAARVGLNRYAVGAVFNAQETGSGLLRILQGRFEGQFPVAFGLSGGRIGWDCTRIPTDAEIPGLIIGTLTYGVDAHDREGPTEGDAGAVATQIQLHRQLQGDLNGPAAVTVADRRNMGALRGAVARWGESPMKRLDCPDVPSEDAAWSVLTDTAVAQSEVRDIVTYLGLDGSWHDAPLFWVVLVTDDECGWEDEPMLITAVAPGLDGRCAVTLLRVRGN